MMNEKQIIAQLAEKSRIAASWAKQVHEHCVMMNQAQRELDKVQAEILKLAESLE
jgi:hypothetical protein